MDLATPPRPTPSRDVGTPAAPAAGVAARLPAPASLRLAGTAALGTLAADDPRLAALRRACTLLEALEADRRALDQRLESAKRMDPMRQATGRTALDAAVEETRELIRQLDEILCAAADGARTTATTHPKDHP